MKLLEEIVEKPSAIADKPLSTMNVNTSKRISFYTQSQQFVVRVLFIVCLFTSCDVFKKSQGSSGGPSSDAHTPNNPTSAEDNVGQQPNGTSRQVHTNEQESAVPRSLAPNSSQASGGEEGRVAPRSLAPNFLQALSGEQEGASTLVAPQSVPLDSSPALGEAQQGSSAPRSLAPNFSPDSGGEQEGASTLVAPRSVPSDLFQALGGEQEGASTLVAPRSLALDSSPALGGEEQGSYAPRSLALDSSPALGGEQQGSSEPPAAGKKTQKKEEDSAFLLKSSWPHGGFSNTRVQVYTLTGQIPALDSRQVTDEHHQGGSSTPSAPQTSAPSPLQIRLDASSSSENEDDAPMKPSTPVLNPQPSQLQVQPNVAPRTPVSADLQVSGEEQQEGNSPPAASPAPTPNPHQGSGKNGVGGTGIGVTFRAITALGSSSSASVGDTQERNLYQIQNDQLSGRASDSFRAASPQIPDPLQAPEQQKSYSELIKKLQALAADPQIDQKPIQLAWLGEVLLQLAAFEQQAGVSATDLSPYTEAAILYQHVLCICAQKADMLGSQAAAGLAQSAYQGLAQTQAAMLARAKGAAPKATTQADVDALKKCISEDRRMLEAFRSDVKSRTINLIENLEAALSNPKSSSEAIKQAEQTYIQGSQELLATIANKLKAMLAKFYQRAEAALGPAPCKYAVMGLGSLALQQATPCADLEFAILMEDAPDEETAAWTAYFRNISHLVHFFVINLCETILPLSKYNVSLHHLGSKGLNLALDGKTPLGSKDKSYYDLIQPVEKMLHCTLERTCHVYGDDKLHEAYQEKQQQLFKSQDKHAYEERMRKKLLEVGSTLPHSQLRVVKTDRGQADKLRTDGPGLHPEDACQLYDVRQELYRMPEVPYRLATYYGLCPESAWNAVEQLEEQQIIGVSEDAKHLAAHRLKYAVSFATMLRLANDMGYGEQSKAPAACTSREEAVSKFFSLPNKAFQENGSLFKYYRIALPLYRAVKGMLHLRSQPQSDHNASSMSSPFGPGNNLTADPKKAYFSASSFYDTSSYAVDIATHHRLLRPQQVKARVDSHLERLKASANNGELGRTHHNLGVIYYHLGAFAESFGHFNRSLALLQKRYPDGDLQVAAVLRSIGIAHYNVREFSESLDYFTQSLKMLRGLYQKTNPETSQLDPAQFETPQLETAQALSSVGAAHEQLGNFQESLAYKQQAVAMLQALYPENSPQVARALLSLGDAYEASNESDKLETSLRHKQEALTMLQAWYGSSHPEVAHALLSLGDAYTAFNESNKFAESLARKKKALAMLQAWYGSSHPEVARAWFSLGETYEAMGQLEVKEKCKMLSKSRTCKTEAVDIFKRFYEDGHPECKQADDSLSSTKSVLLSLQPINSNHSEPLPCTGRMNHTNPTNRTVYAQPFTLLSTPQQEVLDENTLLREYYQRSTFAYIPLLFAEHGCKHLQDLACQLMLREHKRVKEDAKQIGGSNEEGQGAFDHMGIKAVKTLIELQDLFKDRSIHPEKPVKPVKQVLLRGDPGIGKTILGKKMAYQWAEGEWGQEFNTLFWLPVRSLRQSWYDGTSYDRKDTLATAIANNCIDDGSATEAEYHRRCQYIEQELGKPTTLVILDGLNEREGASNKIIREAQDRNARHKLLMISRSAGMETAQQLADIEIEHAGFNLYQIERYVQQEIPDSEQPEQLLGYLYKHANICSIAQVPVNLQLLCAFWRDESCKARKEELEKGSLARLYRSLTAYMWERFSKQHCQDNTLNTILLSECQEGYFISLSKIALSALEQGNVLIGDQQVQDLLGDAIRDMIQESGLLQAASNGHCQFPNLMFQEYFASCALAQQFMSKDEETKKEASELVANRKYESQYARVLSFMAGEVSITKGVQSIKHLLSLLGEREKEIRGLQHLLLQLRVVHEWLCVVSPEEAAQGMTELEKEFQVLSSLEQWFDTAFKYVRLEGYGPNSTGRNLITLLTDSLQTFRSIVAYIPGVFDLLQRAAQNDNSAIQKAALGPLATLCAAAPEGWARKALSRAQEALESDNDRVRRSALKVLSTLVQASPGQAEQFLSIIQNTLTRDRAKHVRSTSLAVTSKLAETWTTQKSVPIMPAGSRKASIDCGQYSRSASAECLAPSLSQILPAAAKAKASSIIPKGLQDKSEDVRKTTLETLSTLIKASPSLAQEALPNIQTGLRDVSEQVREAALKALSSLIAASPDQAQGILENTKIVLQDASENIRKAAFGILSSLIEVSPKHAQEALPSIQTGLQDPSEDVRKAAFGALSSLIEVSTEHAPEALKNIQRGLQDTSEDVRKAALGVLPSLIEVSSALVPQALAIITQTVLHDASKHVRRAALGGLSSLINQYPEQVPNALQKLQEALEDEASDVCDTSLQVLFSLLKTSPPLQEQIFPILLAAFKVKYRRACSAAFHDLSSLVQQSPALSKEALTFLEKVSNSLHSASAGEVSEDLSNTLVNLKEQCGHTGLGTQGPSSAEASPGQGFLLLGEAAKDLVWHVREAALKALSLLIQTCPKQAQNAFPIIQKAAEDQSWCVRQAALEALHSLIKTSIEYPQEALTIVLEALKDENSSVCRTACDALSILLQQSPALAPQALPSMLEAAKDGSCRIRQVAFNALSTLLQQSPDQAEKALPGILAGIKDRDFAVRPAALQALSSLLQVSPAQVEEALQGILNALQDSNVDVRSAALKAFTGLLQAPPSLPQAAFTNTQEDTTASDSDVRLTPREVLLSLLKESPALVQAALERILKIAQDNDAAVRQAALEALFALIQASPAQPERALQGILKALQDSNVDVRSTALEALSTLVQASPAQTERALQGILKALQDSNADVRSNALEALSALIKASPAQAEGALQGILKAIENRNADVRSNALEALSALIQASPSQAEGALQGILEATKNRNADIRSTALVALSTLVQASPSQAEGALQCLKDALKDKHSAIRQAALEALPTLVEVATPQSTPSSSPILPRMLSRTPPSSLASEALGSLQETLKDSALDVRKTALVVLSKLVKISPDLTQKVLPSLQKALEDSDPDVRTAALVALPKLVEASPKKAAAALPSIQKALKDNDPDVRSAALAVIATLIQQSSSLAPQALVSLQKALEDSDPDVRSAALAVIATLIQQSSSLAPQALVSLQNALQDSDLDVRTAALVALPKLVEASPKKAKEVFGSLQKVLQDSDPDVRSTALKALPTLAERSPDLALEALPSMLNATKDEDFDVRSTALEARSTLVKKYPDLARQALQSIQADLQHRHKHVRKDAHKILRTLIEKSPSRTSKTFLSIREALQQSRQDGDPDVLKASGKALSAVIQAFPDSTNTTLPSLQESVEDANFDDRRATLATISTLVKASPALTQTAFPSLLSSLEHVLKDQDVDLRQAALKALVTLINVSKQVQTALPSTQPNSQAQLSDGSSNALLQACTSSSKDQILKNILAAAQDANSDVRSSALQALSTGIQAYPALASHPEIYQFLQNTIQDETDYVRTASLEVLCLLLQSSPEQVLTMLPNLVAAIKKKHCKACQAASDLLDSLHQALPRNESADLPIILAALKDKNSGIRRACLQALSSWIQSSPALAQKTWEDMMKATQDENSGIRKAALQALCSVIEASPALAPKIWQSMMKATQDENSEVLQAALKALCTWINTLPDQVQKTWPSMMEVTEHSDTEVLQAALGALYTCITLPDQVQAVLISILRAAKNKHTAVREAALKTLSILLQASPSQSQRALPNILAATKDINADVREAALQALYTVINISSDQVQKVLPSILKATKDKDLNVRKAALGLLLQVTTEQLLAYYWSTSDARIIPYIVPRLAHNSLVVGEARDSLQPVRLYTASGQTIEWRQPEAVKCFRGHFQNEVDKLNRMYSGLLTRVDASVWEHYFGAIGNEPRLPDDLEIIMNSPCPFCPGQQVRDTHWLVLIPSHVKGKPLTLDYLEQLIKRPKNGYATEYSGYLEEVRKTIGNKSPDSSYWVLVTRAMLPESIGKSYQDQRALVEQHPGYAVSRALEALVVMVMHHVRDREHLDSVKTKCLDCYDQEHPVVVQGSPPYRNQPSNGPYISASLAHIDAEPGYGVVGCRRLQAIDLGLPAAALCDAARHNRLSSS